MKIMNKKKENIRVSKVLKIKGPLVSSEVLQVFKDWPGFCGSVRCVNYSSISNR